MLVDAGNNDDADYILNYLNTLGVEKLDYVIGTHPHEDHIGSLDAVINNYEIGTLIMPEKAHNTKTFEDVVTAIENKRVIHYSTYFWVELYTWKCYFLNNNSK